MFAKIALPIQKENQINKPTDAYNCIKELLLRQLLNPGQRLQYRDLAEMIGMSKTPIAAALNRLEYEGIVIYEVNRGYRIRPINEKEISELFELRIELETLNVRNAIKNFTQEEFKKLCAKFSSLSNYNPQFTDGKKLFLDMDYHIRMGGNSYAIRFLQSIIENIYLRYRIERGVESRKKEIETEHRLVLESIKKRDTEKAVKYMTIHLEELHHLMLHFLRSFKSSYQTEWHFQKAE
jgi:DNA-binding GntR family transcriptional regulator